MNTGSVDIISREIIKPSSPTPHKTLKLSFLDQLVPPFYVPVIFFYGADELTIPIITKSPHITTQISQNLKTSFSDALSLFYPLAGKLDPANLAVDCNDAGAEFVQARVHSCMDDVIQDPKMGHLLKYLPTDPDIVISSNDAPPPLLAVQINFFHCGGIAVGICSSHQLTDADSLVAFIRTWAESCRRRQGQKSNYFTPPPIFDLARHFPPRDLSGSGFSQSVYVKREKLVTKRFVFDAEKLAALRRAATSPSGSTVKDPTRVELVSAFIWKNIIIGSGKNQISAACAWHVVNLRPGITSLAMENVFGNCILKHFINFSGDVGPEFHELVGRLRNGLREVNEEYIWKAGKDDSYLNSVSKCFDLTINRKMETCGFSSWCRFPVYEVDFGMGNPVWVCPTSCPEKNVCFLMGTKGGDGIELLVNMLESSAQLVCSKFELLGKSEV